MKCSCASFLLVYVTRRTAYCVALAISMIFVPTEVMHVSVFARYAVAVSCYMAELQDRAPLQAQSAIQFWLDRESRLSQLALDLVAPPVSQAYVERLFSLCGDLREGKRNRT